MTSIVDICNRALSAIATRSSITSFNDGSVEGYQCGLWYDEMRQRLLRTAQWGFARMQVQLTQLGDAIPDNTAPYPFGYSYAYPSICLRMRYILAPPPPNYSGPSAPPVVGQPLVGPMFPAPSRTNRFLIMNSQNSAGQYTKLLVSNIYQAYGVFTGDITDPNQFDPMFRDALTSAIAAKIALPLSGNVGMMKDFIAAAELDIQAARVADSEAITTTDHTVDWINTRGVGSPYGYGAGSNLNIGGWGSVGQWWGGIDPMNWGA